MKQWYEELFDDRYLVCFEEVLHGGAALEEIDFIDRALGLAANGSILDLGCGFGRHAIPLALRGHRVTGVDLSERMLEVAKRMSHELGAEVEWLRCDMRYLGELGPFDACVCLYTVLGYFGEEENARVLAEIRRVLVPGGTLLLDVDNPLALLQRWRETHWAEARRGVRREVHDYDPMTARLVSERTFFGYDGTRFALPSSSVRLYAPHELAAMLRTAGFEIEQLHGGLSGQPFDWQRSRSQVWVARRS